MTVTERIGHGKVVNLPAEAGDVDSPRFSPNDEWLRDADATLQQAAMWRWFATRFESPITAVPHDPPSDDRPSEFLFLDGAPAQVDQVLHDRFDPWVPAEVVDELVASVRAEAGNEWVPKTVDRFGG